MGRYLIQIGEDELLYEVLPDTKEFKKGFGYIHDGLVYIYAGKAKNHEILEPGNVYKVEDGTYSWVPPLDVDERSTDKLIDISAEKIIDDIKKGNLKEVDPIILELSSSVFAPALKEDDDILKRVVKLILHDMQTDFKDRDKKKTYDVSNIKSAILKDAPLSWKYFMKYVEILKLDVTLNINFTDSSGNDHTLNYHI